MYTHPVAGMVETAKSEASRRALTNIQFKQCSADDLPFPDGSFDVAPRRR
jgi:ubiquinone/menaquinone biosynthesis C-methylase UbiE